MQELLPGVFHWKAFHEGIGMDVGSHFVRAGEAGALIDPMEPPAGTDAVGRLGSPSTIVLSNRHHWRHSDRFVDAFGCSVRCHRAGLHEFDDGREVQPLDLGDAPAPGITALEMGGICDDDTALHIAAGHGAILFADALIRYGDSLSFVPDELIGADAEAAKRKMTESMRALLDVDFDSLLFAHGEPLIGGGRAALREFVERST